MVHATTDGQVTKCNIEIRHESAVDGSGAVRPVEIFRNLPSDYQCQGCALHNMSDAHCWECGKHVIAGYDERILRAHLRERHGIVDYANIGTERSAEFVANNFANCQPVCEIA